MADISVSSPATGLSRSNGLTAILATALSGVIGWHSAWVQRQRIHRLDDHLRRDIGLIRAAPLRASVRPGWDVPLAGLR